MSEYIHKRHNVSILLYHYVCPTKYRRVIFDDFVDRVLVQTCKEISKRYELNIVEICTDGDHVHFLIQSVPSLSSTMIVRIIKSITVKEIYRLCPQVKKKLWDVMYGAQDILSVQLERMGMNSESKITLEIKEKSIPKFIGDN